MTRPEMESIPHYSAVRHLARRRIEDEVVVLDLRRSRIYGLNPSAGEVLEALQAPLTVAQVAGRFAAEGSDAPSIFAELRRFIEELAGLGLVERQRPPEGEGGAPETPGFAAWVPPVLLWREEVARVTNQISPPQQIGNPACLP